MEEQKIHTIRLHHNGRCKVVQFTVELCNLDKYKNSINTVISFCLDMIGEGRIYGNLKNPARQTKVERSLGALPKV